MIKLVQQNTLTVTTFFDYYGLPDDFPGVSNKADFKNSQQRVAHLETRLYDDIDSRNFIPYVQLHEFEALLFTSIDGFRYCNSDSTKIQSFQRIIDQFPNPEDINDSPTTAPSKRILSIMPNYKGLSKSNRVLSAYLAQNRLNRCTQA